MTTTTVLESAPALRLDVAGSGRGATALVPHLLSYGREKEASVLARFVDPTPGKAVGLSRRAADAGMEARCYEGKIEEVIDTEPATTSPLILTIDDPAAIASAICSAIPSSRPILGYLLLRLPKGELFALALCCEATDQEKKHSAAEFFEHLARFTARSSSVEILGVGAKPGHVAIEPVYRAWIAGHMKANIPLLLSGRAPLAAPFTLTASGGKSLSLHVVRNPSGFGDPERVARRIVEDPASPMQPGEDFMMADCAPEGIRFYRCRIKMTDGRLWIRGTTFTDPEGLARLDDRARELQVRRQALTLERAAEAEARRTRALLVTD